MKRSGLIIIIAMIYLIGPLAIVHAADAGFRFDMFCYSTDNGETWSCSKPFNPITVVNGDILNLTVNDTNATFYITYYDSNYYKTSGGDVKLIDSSTANIADVVGGGGGGSVIIPFPLEETEKVNITYFIDVQNSVWDSLFKWGILAPAFEIALFFGFIFLIIYFLGVRAKKKSSKKENFLKIEEHKKRMIR